MSLYNTSLSNYATKTWAGIFEFTYRELDQLASNEAYYFRNMTGSQSILIPIGGYSVGGHLPDGNAVTVLSTSQNSCTVTQDSTLKFNIAMPYDYPLEFGEFIPEEWARTLAKDLAQWRQSVIELGIIGSVADRTSTGAQVTRVTSLTDDGTITGAAVTTALSALRGRKASFGNMFSFVTASVFTNMRKVPYIASSLFQGSSFENSTAGPSFRYLDCKFMTESNVLGKDYDTTANVALTGATSGLDTKYYVSGLKNLCGVIWDRTAFAVGEAQAPTSMIERDTHINAWNLQSRTKFGTKVIKTDGMQLLYNG